MTSPWRVVVADDHVVSRSGLAFLLSAEKGLQVVGEATDGLAALEMVGELQPDLLILDVMLPKLTGIVVLERLQGALQKPRVLMISGSVAGTAFKQAFDLGADGLLSKEDDAEELITAIASLRRGERYLSKIVRALVGPLLDSDDGGAAVQQLTQREREVFVLVAEGQSNKEIGEALNISPGTAKKHREHIRAKLGFTSVTEATRIAARLGMIKLS